MFTIKRWVYALPLVLSAGISHAVPVITASLSIDGGITYDTASNIGSGGSALVTGADFTTSPSSLFIIGATSEAPLGFLQDTQVNFRLNNPHILDVIIRDDDYVVGTTGDYSFYTVSNSSSIIGTTITLDTFVDGVSIYGGTLVAGQTGVLGSGSISLTAGVNYDIKHVYNFTSIAGVTTGTANLTTTTLIPEPSMAALLGAGLLGFGFFGFRRKSL